MGISNGYATLAEYKAYHDIDSTDATDDGVIEDLIEAASRFIDGQCNGRTFYGRTETRYYSVPSGRKLYVDSDLLSITTLTNGDGTTISSSDYYLLPRNESPKFAIVLTEATSVQWYPDSNNNYDYVISVAGSWGMASTRPDDINVACLEITKSAYERRKGENMDGVLAQTAAGGVVISPRDISEYAWRIIRANAGNRT